MPEAIASGSTLAALAAIATDTATTSTIGTITARAPVRARSAIASFAAITAGTIALSDELGGDELRRARTRPGDLKSLWLFAGCFGR